MPEGLDGDDDKADKEQAEFEVMDDYAKTNYLTEMLRWKKAVENECRNSDSSKYCICARNLRDQIEVKRKITNFYA